LAKFYPTQPIPQLGVTSAQLSTAWRDGNLYAQLSLTPPPKASRGFAGLGKSPYRLQLTDASGFNIVDYAIPAELIVHRVDDKGKPLSLTSNFSVPLSKDTYKSINSWSVTWVQ
jgi:hypothetical protein